MRDIKRLSIIFLIVAVGIDIRRSKYIQFKQKSGARQLFRQVRGDFGRAFLVIQRRRAKNPNLGTIYEYTIYKD